MSISFNQIPIDIRVPGQYVEIDNSQAVRGLPGMPSRILVLGLMDANAEAPAGVPFDATSADLVATRCGRGSMVHRMVKVLRAANRTTRLTVIPLAEDPAAAAATGSLTFSGEATAAGTIALMVGGQRVRVGVTARRHGPGISPRPPPQPSMPLPNCPSAPPSTVRSPARST